MKTTTPSEQTPDYNYWINYIYSLLKYPNATRYIQNRNADKGIVEKDGAGEVLEPVRSTKQNRAVKKETARSKF
jgi:hypothetical protein